MSHCLCTESVMIYVAREGFLLETLKKDGMCNLKVELIASVIAAQIH